MGVASSKDESQNTDQEAKCSEAEAKTNNSNSESKEKLPHNYEIILREADSVIDKSPIDELNDQLYNGVFLNKKKQKYWVERNSKGNCFFLFARDLSITWAEDNRFWYWPYHYETSVEVAELINVCWLEIHGKFDTTRLSPNVLYEVGFVIMVKENGFGWEVPVNTRITLPNGTKQQHKENLSTKQKGQWIQIPAGEFITSPENIGELEISLYEYEGGKWKRGLVVKGVTIRPKN